jgi:hypothetical protein
LVINLPIKYERTLRGTLESDENLEIGVRERVVGKVELNPLMYYVK